MKEKLLFVYNADSDLFSAVTDFAHKILSPSTYGCHLCALTYGNFGIKQEWKKYLQALDIETIFKHKDEFEKEHNTQVDLPAIFVLTDREPKVLITSDEIAACTSLQELEKMISEKLNSYVEHHHPNVQ